MLNIPSILFDFEQKHAVFEIEQGAKKKTSLHASSIDDALLALASGGFFDSGLLPVGDGSGLLALRGGFGHLQIAYQVEPGIHQVIWGARERDETANYWQLAQPYRIWVADFFNGNISGARHFYSLTPVHTLDTPLFHVNLPNTNCKGYNGTGVGWMCLYHRHDTSSYDTKQLIEYAYQRAGGGEAYNDANMSGTDGPRYYQSHKAPKYFWDPHAWQEKSRNDGWQWTLDDKLLLPIMVNGADDQNQQGGNHRLVFDDVINGTYYSSYPSKKIDVYPLKPVSALKRGVLFDMYPDLISEFLKRQVQAKSKPMTGAMAARVDTNVERVISSIAAFQILTAPPVPLVECYVCKTAQPEDTVQEVNAIFPDSLEELLETATVPVCEGCSGQIVTAQIDFLYSRGPDHNGPSIEPVKTLAHLTASYPGFPRFVASNRALLSACPSCSVYYPRYAADWKIDIDVWGYNNETKQEQVVGCINCFDHFFCEISKHNVADEHGVQVEMVNHHVNPPEPYTTMVADYLVVLDDSPYKICACGIASNKQLHSELVVNDSPVCNGCVLNGEYHSAFQAFIEAQQHPVHFIDANAPLHVDEPDDFDDDDYTEDDHENDDEDAFF